MATTEEISSMPVSTGERYATAIVGSNMSVDTRKGARRSPGDIVAAAGMHDKETGKALMRLRAEWDTQAMTKPLTREALEALSREYTIEPSTSPHAGKVRQDVKDKTGQVIGVEYVLPMALAWKHSQQWREHENKLVLQRLKSLPAVRDILVDWLDHEDGPHIVAAVLMWWLDKACPTCEGRGKRVAEGTGRLTNKACQSCAGLNRIPGERKVPHSGEGRRLANQIEKCVGDAENATRTANA